MKDLIKNIKDKVLAGKGITYEDALKIINIDEEDIENLEVIFESANEIREKFTGKKVDLCSIVNAKSGKCSENCKYCAQSSHYKTSIEEYELLDYESIVKKAQEAESQGVHRFSLVTSGRGIKGDEELEKLVSIYKRLNKETNLKLCASHGIISYEQAKRLKEAGVSRYHHNIETSESYYSNICTSHTYKERIDTIKNVMNAGMTACSGGILGLGESRENRVKMAFELKELGITSIPLNVLTPVKGTPLENNKVLSPLEILKTMALYRFVIPNSYIRYAGGRVSLKDKQALGFRAGVNAALVGDFLTTLGSNVDEDKKMITSQGLEI